MMQLPHVITCRRSNWLLAAALMASLLLCGDCCTFAAELVSAKSASNRSAPGDRASEAQPSGDPNFVPDWAASAVFYQIFPERFCNGDPSNDPTWESLEFPEKVSKEWSITPWTSDWYARAEWEKQGGPDFYENGVFDRRYGGDLQGIIDKLDYLQDLGVNALYLNPVFYARSLHKYDGNTYHHVDPHFGPDPAGDFELMKRETSDPSTWQWTAADKLFLKLIDQTHRRGMRIIIDGVFNHTGRNFFAFEDLKKNQQKSPYRDWYIVHRFDNPDTPEHNEFQYKGWWGVMTLPEFADTEARDDLHPGPKQYVFDATSRWMDPNGDGDPSDGIDGWRLDVAVEIPIKFWQDWNRHCRTINPNCYTVAENWEDAAGYLVEGGFSATMNYHGFAFPVKGFLIDGTLSATDAAEALTNRMQDHGPLRRYALQNLIDSHDTDRVASMVVNADTKRPYLQPERFDYDVGERVSPRNWDGYQCRKPTDEERKIQKLVALMQATFVGAPMVYYGTEAGMWGGDDPCDRLPMVWEDLEFENQSADPRGRKRPSDPVAFNQSLHDYYRELLKMRRDSETLCRGGFEVLKTNDKTNVLAFRRTGNEENIIVIFNRGNAKSDVRLPLPPQNDVTVTFVSFGTLPEVDIHWADGQCELSVASLQGVVLRERSVRGGKVNGKSTQVGLLGQTRSTIFNHAQRAESYHIPRQNQ